MDDNEFEFPPDQLDDVVASRLSPYQTAIPSPLRTPFAYPAANVPLSMLAQIPLEHLPPTQPKNPQNFSIGQVLRGALSTSHMRVPPGGSRMPRPIASVAPLPHSQRLHQQSPMHSPYLSAGHPPLPSASSDEEERGGGAEGAYQFGEGGGEEAHGGSALGLTELQMRARRFPNRQARIDWSEGEVRSFYQALSQYGTDFSAIAVLFPGRTRRDIKRLYQREMRQKPKEVQTALNQKHPIDMAAFEVRYEAKKKEAQQPVKMKKLNSEELAFLDEIAGRQPSESAMHVKGEDLEVPVPAATLGDVEEATAAPPSRPRKRRRDTHQVDSEDGLESKRATKEIPPAADNDFDMEQESLFDMAMRHEREDNAPLDMLFAVHLEQGQQQHQAALEDSDFSFE
ncbi:conserved hypothetical protein [Leishmania mexicana MHOM/GT/2001/U1103]|uniref:Myb-like domain-containing protein n=1 Tax=Leishmania mexicana (strain MHOM/GT/2001/U1103) TaxID=929439 RepID=E9AU89_LEIMU|nr:conserved hypothetical protein [Leishmania mexicana MHOM/GT/2001/U1103]CBZ26515.1 conserved hypothetical protein [Leishmania mexicana MHOM/GT/2001/U1103]